MLQSQPPDRDDATLEDEIKRFGAEDMPDDCKAYATMMLQLLYSLEHRSDELDLWAYTGHQYVTLRSHQKGEEHGGVRIHTWFGQYVVRYAWHTEMRPWPDADVERRTSHVAEATDLILAVLHQPMPLYTERPPLRRISSQQSETLETYYTRLGQQPALFPPECVQAMVSLIRYLKEWGIGTDLWVYTSQEKLYLTDRDAAVGGIEVTATPSWYVISSPAAAPEVLWDQAHVIGRANHVATAAHMLERAIQRTFQARI
jgi:hypothetical protein